MKDKTTIFIFAVIIIFFIVLGSIVTGSQSKKSTVDDLISLPVQPTSGLSNSLNGPTTSPQQTEVDATIDWKTYAIPFLKISVKVPPEWFIATDETDKNHVRILSESPVASPEASITAFKLDIYKLKETKPIKNLVDLRIELTKDIYKEITQKGKMAGEREVQVDKLVALYRELQGTGSAIQQLFLVTPQGTLGLFESSSADENQINIYKIIISTIKAL